jgi:hypothetical protein
MSFPIKRSSRSGYLAAVAISSIVLIGGCSSDPSAPPSEPAASVASVPRSSSSEPAGQATTAAADRPLIRLDTTPEETDRMYEAYNACLTEQGVPPKAARKLAEDNNQYTAAFAACANQEPEDYQEREKRLNPAAFADHQREQIKCMREHGLAIETGPDGWGYTNPARDMGSAWDVKCARQAFGD